MKHTASIQRQELPLHNSLGNFSSLHFEVNFEENRIKSMDVGCTKAQLPVFWETLESASRTYVLKEWMVCGKKEKISAPLAFWSDFCCITLSYMGNLPKLIAILQELLILFTEISAQDQIWSVPFLRLPLCLALKSLGWKTVTILGVTGITKDWGTNRN